MDNRNMIQKSLDYIEDNLQTDISATELAEAAGFSLYLRYLRGVVSRTSHADHSQRSESREYHMR